MDIHRILVVDNEPDEIKERKMKEMKELCRRCKFFDESKVENEIFLCPKTDLAIWFELDVYIGECGAFESK